MMWRGRPNGSFTSETGKSPSERGEKRGKRKEISGVWRVGRFRASRSSLPGGVPWTLPYGCMSSRGKGRFHATLRYAISFIERRSRFLRTSRKGMSAVAALSSIGSSRSPKAHAAKHVRRFIWRVALAMSTNQRPPRYCTKQLKSVVSSASCERASPANATHPRSNALPFLFSL